MRMTLVFECQYSANLFIDQLVQDLTNNNNNSNPTSKSFIKSLKTVKATKSFLRNTSSSCCPICLDDFELDQKLVRLRCRHGFHRDCILPWLNRKSTCPMCRYELPKQAVLYWKEMLPDGFKFVIYRSSSRIATLTVSEEGTATRVYVEEVTV